MVSSLFPIRRYHKKWGDINFYLLPALLQPEVFHFVPEVLEPPSGRSSLLRPVFGRGDATRGDYNRFATQVDAVVGPAFRGAVAGASVGENEVESRSGGCHGSLAFHNPKIPRNEGFSKICLLPETRWHFPYAARSILLVVLKKDNSRRIFALRRRLVKKDPPKDINHDDRHQPKDRAKV